VQSRYQAAKKASHWKARVFIAAAVTAALFGVGLGIHRSRRWNQAVAALNDVPGIIVAPSLRNVVEGFRDPLADPVGRVLADHSIDPQKVSMRLRPFLSLDPTLVLKRARIYLQPPDGVMMGLDQNVLAISGSAPHLWILQARNAAGPLSMAGIREIRTGELQDTQLESLRTLIEGQSIVFSNDSSVLRPAQLREASLVASRLREWIGDANAIGRAATVCVVGQSDAKGPTPLNSALSRRRAANVAAVLIAASVPARSLLVVGVGALSSSYAQSSPESRKVTFHLSLGEPRNWSREAP
jgi:outer membrane protein OmpA-like peptidoglycan-associated protein